MMELPASNIFWVRGNIFCARFTKPPSCQLPLMKTFSEPALIIHSTR